MGGAVRGAARIVPTGASTAGAPTARPADGEAGEYGHRPPPCAAPRSDRLRGAAGRGGDAPGETHSHGRHHSVRVTITTELSPLSANHARHVASTGCHRGRGSLGATFRGTLDFRRLSHTPGCLSSPEDVGDNTSGPLRITHKHTHAYTRTHELQSSGVDARQRSLTHTKGEEGRLIRRREPLRESLARGHESYWPSALCPVPPAAPSPPPRPPIPRPTLFLLLFFAFRPPVPNLSP